MSSNHGKLGRNLIGGDLQINSRIVIDHLCNLYVDNAAVEGNIAVDLSAEVGGDLTVLGSGSFGAPGGVANGPALVVEGAGTTGTGTLLVSSQTANQILTLPNATDTLVGKATTDVLTNKTITAATDNVTASALFSGSRANTVSVYAANNPTAGQVLTATSATVATWQTPAAGALGFAMFYGNAPGDYSSTIGVGTAMDFPHAGPTGGASAITRSGAGTFVLPAIGTYDISWMASISEAGQLELTTTNLGLITYSTTGRATGTSLITNRVFVTTTTVNDVLSVLNPPGNSTALTVTPTAGGTHAAAATLCIIRIA